MSWKVGSVALVSALAYCYYVVPYVHDMVLLWREDNLDFNADTLQGEDEVLSHCRYYSTRGYYCPGSSGGGYGYSWSSSDYYSNVIALIVIPISFLPMKVIFMLFGEPQLMS
jgi:hypothetical protein